MSRTAHLLPIAARWILLLMISGSQAGVWASMSEPHFIGWRTPSDASTTTASRRIVSHGVPFIETPLWISEEEGARSTLDTRGVIARRLYLLGGLNSVDEANPAWGGGDSFQNLFVGDEAGSITLCYAGGARDVIPLVFGYTIFWRAPHQHSHAPFSIDPAAAALLDSALCVSDAASTTASHGFLTIALRAEPLEQILLIDNPLRKGRPILLAATLDGVRKVPEPSHYEVLDVPPPDPDFEKWLESHTIPSPEPYSASRRAAVRELARSMYTYPEDISASLVAATVPDTLPHDTAGPQIRFMGPPEADILTHVYRDNGQNLIGRIDTTGMVHESEKEAPYYGGYGGYRPNVQAFRDDAYTRNRSVMLLCDMGFIGESERAIGFFDHWLMYFPMSWPQLQLGGKPVPGHWTVIANKPHVYFDVLQNHGWKTKFKTRDFGNPETDGHGILMLTHWRQWAKLGRPREWIRQRWIPIREAAEYIPWALDNPDLSFSEHGLLYAESEGGMLRPSVYCDMACLFGLRAYAEMAAAIGEHDAARRWNETADRLSRAIDAWYPTQKEPWGDVWDPEKGADWAVGHALLAPVLFGCDYLGYDVAQRLPAHWRARTERTYNMQLTRNRPEWCAPAGLGYGQNYIAQAALLLDRTADARRLVDWLARFCFYPRLQHPYRVPEGVTMAADGSVWRRWGDLGNLYQMAETVYTCRVMAGVDDRDSACVRIMPRLPAGWSGIEVSGQPVRVGSGEESQQAKLGYRFEVDHAGAGKQQMTISVDTRVPVRARLGPFPPETTKVELTVDNRSSSGTLIRSGDASWLWVEAVADRDAPTHIAAHPQRGSSVP